MHLKLIEDYVCDLMGQSMERPRSKKRIDLLCGELMDLLIEQEKLIPDFVVSGDEMGRSVHYVLPSLDNGTNEGTADVKKMLWLMATAAVASVCFLVGFFVAP